jgi:hypothetical protein
VIKSTLVAAAFAVALLAPASAPVTRHDAKIRSFKALLHMTEQRPDVTDATHASITIGSCHRVANAFSCEGELYPVAFSGIDGSRCSYRILVFAHSLRLREIACD